MVVVVVVVVVVVDVLVVVADGITVVTGGSISGEGTLLLTGTVGEETLGRVRDAFVKELGENAGVEMLAGFPTANGAVDAACSAGSVVWVEAKHVSQREQVKRAAEVFETSGANVIGAILV